MSDLDEEASALLRSGRAAFRPQPSDRDRVLLLLGRALAGSPGEKPGSTDVAGGVSQARFPLRSRLIVGGVAAFAIGAGALLATHAWNGAPLPPRVASVLPVASPGPPPQATAPSLPPAPGADDPSAGPPRVERPSRSPPPAPRSTGHPDSDSLAEEVRLLSRAEKQLSDGRGEDALATLGEHQRRFPQGVLAEERMAARVEAFCSLGRIADAKADWARLASAFPSSAHLGAVRRFCGGALDGPP